MAEVLKPFLHRSNGESYLFGFEDYMTLKELKDLWRTALWALKNESPVPYGDLIEGDLVPLIADGIGLRPPAKGSDLYDYVHDEERWVTLTEQDYMQRVRETGRDLDEEFFDEHLPLAIYKIGRE